jgi:hypothetical protein
MAPDRLDYFLMLASTAEPDTQGALRDAVIETVAELRRCAVVREAAQALLDDVRAAHDCAQNDVTGYAVCASMQALDRALEKGERHPLLGSSADAPVPSDAVPTAKQATLTGSLGAMVWDSVDDDDGDPEGCA